MAHVFARPNVIKLYKMCMRAHWKPRVAVRFACFLSATLRLEIDAALRDATHEGSPCRENQLKAQPHRLRQRR